MRFSFCINDDPAGCDLATGFIDAADAVDALRQLDDPRANVYPAPEDREMEATADPHAIHHVPSFPGAADCLVEREQLR